MDQEQWSPDYQQSVTASIERTINKSSSTKIPGADAEPQNSQIKEDPDANTIFPGVKDEFEPASVVISEKSIQLILAQIKSLSQNEKYLLYLKLSSEIGDVIDPFRQHVNPLGSRSEISRTIVWIQTHLEEDLNISLPKKEVYNEYEQYCKTNNIKPLSQADFGKVMKQVFPKVRARRLGQRGNSKYCYSGLTRRVNLQPPLLPDLIDRPLSTEAPSINQSSVTYAAWLIVRDWAQRQLGVQFTSLQSLGHYLVRNCSIGSGSEAAHKLASNVVETQPKGEEAVSKNINKHRETQLQVQKTIRQRIEGKERKRKIQSTKPEIARPGTKKCRSHSVPASTVASALLSHESGGTGGGTSGDCSTASSSCGSNSVSPTQGRTICDKPEFTQLTALPDFKSFQKPATADVVAPKAPSGCGQEKTSIGSGKVAIPRLQQQQQQQTSPKGSVPGQAKAQPRKAKYKTIQPRLQPCDIATYNAPAQPITPQTVVAALADTRSQLVQVAPEDSVNDKITDNKCAENLNECVDDEDFPLTRERLDSVSNVEKDAMDEYLGTNNSQHEEELSKYFNTNGETEVAPDMDHSTKLSTLRQLLEQNVISEKRSAAAVPGSAPVSIESNITLPDAIPSFPNAIAALPQMPSQRAPYPYALSTLTGLSGSARRRVSFETPAPEDSVPPSPNTKNKNFNFTPISPGPHSPGGAQSSKCSSTSASPFVSPRNTPIPRTKNTTHQNAGIMLVDNRGAKHVKVKKELLLDLSLEIPPANNHQCMPMSAPVSPMLSNNNGNSNNNNNKSMLQKLLNAHSKVQYTPEYAAAAAAVPSLPQAAEFFPDLSSRSRSVPLSQMQAAGFAPMGNGGPQIISDIMMKRDPEFNADQESDESVKRLFLNSLDNNNIEDAFNLDMSSSNQCLTEYGLNLINTCSEVPADFPSYAHQTQKLRHITRSQSIDFDVNKCNNPSRSVPSTPLPFTQNLKINLMDNNKHHFPTSSRSYPSTPLNSNETFVYNSDCLLNGQPIRSESTENLEFVPSFQLSNETNVAGQMDNDFGIIEHGEALMDESDILIQQGYNGNIN